MSNQIDIAYVTNYDIARKIAKFFHEEGYDVGISNVSITTGTHGEHQNWRLDIMEPPVIRQCIECNVEREIIYNRKCIDCFSDEILEG